MLGNNSLGLHLGQHSAAGGEEVAGGSASHRFDSDGVGVDFDAHFLVVVAAAGALAKLSGLIRIQGVAGVVDVEEDVFFLFNEGRSFFWRFGSTCGVCVAFVFYNLRSSVAGALTFLVEQTPWRWWRMWPFCVSSDS